MTADGTVGEFRVGRFSMSEFHMGAASGMLQVSMTQQLNLNFHLVCMTGLVTLLQLSSVK